MRHTQKIDKKKTKNTKCDQTSIGHSVLRVACVVTAERDDRTKNSNPAAMISLPHSTPAHTNTFFRSMDIVMMQLPDGNAFVRRLREDEVQWMESGLIELIFDIHFN